MQEDHIPEDRKKVPAVVGPVERPVRPCAWQSGRSGASFVSDEALQNVPVYCEVYTIPLYSLTPEEVAAVNKLRARKEWMKRDTARCKCDHNEYCEHCWPESFRPGGVWHGLGA